MSWLYTPLWGTPLLTVSAVGVAGDFTMTVIPESPVTVTLRGQCTVTRKLDGSEQRVAAATKPFETYDMVFLVNDEESREIRANLLAMPAGRWLIPLAHHSMAVLSDIAGPTISVSTTTLNDFMRIGQRVLIANTAARTSYEAVIQTVSASSFDVDVPAPDATYKKNVTMVYPLMACILNQPVAVGRYAVNLSLLSVKALRCEVDPALGTGGATLATYDGVTLLDRLPLLGGTMAQEQTDSEVVLVDHGGIPESYFSGDLGAVQRAHKIQVLDDADRQYWRKFLLYCRGRQKSFLMPTWRHDFIVSVQPTTSDLIVTGTRYTDQLAGYDMTSRLHIELASGVVLHREISSSVDNGDGTETLTLDSAIDTGAVGPISKVSLLERVRLASDSTAWEFSKGPSTLSVIVVSCRA